MSDDQGGYFYRITVTGLSDQPVTAVSIGSAEGGVMLSFYQPVGRFKKMKVWRAVVANRLRRLARR